MNGTGAVMALMVSGLDSCAASLCKLQEQFEEFGKAIYSGFIPMRWGYGLNEGPLESIVTVDGVRVDGMYYAASMASGIRSRAEAQREALRLLNGGPSTRSRKK